MGGMKGGGDGGGFGGVKGGGCGGKSGLLDEEPGYNPHLIKNVITIK